MAGTRALPTARITPAVGASTAGIAVSLATATCLLRPTLGLYVSEAIGLVAALVVAGLALLVASQPDVVQAGRWTRILPRVAAVGFAFALLSVGFDIVVVAGDGLRGVADTTARAAVLRGGDYQSALARCFGLCVVAIACSRNPRRRSGRLLLAVGALLVDGSFLLMGHVRTHHPLSLVVIAALAHVVAASAWIGGVIGLGAELRRTPYDVETTGRLVATFARLMTGVLALLLSGGVLLALLYLPSLSAVATTAYGQVLVVKLGVVAALLVVSASNHFRLVPQASSGNRTAVAVLRMNVTVEQIALVTVLVVTEVLMRQSPS